METGLAGKVALVAAASKGLGRAIAEAFAAEGMSLAICARGEPALAGACSALERIASAPVHGVPADLSRTDGIARAARSTLERFGPRGSLTRPKPSRTCWSPTRSARSGRTGSRSGTAT